LSNNKILKIAITFSNGDVFYGDIARGLMPKESYRFNWFSDYETSFSYVVHFVDGGELKSTSHYIVSKGETIKVDITENDLKHTVSHFFKPYTHSYLHR
jgi:hypothetical protein